MFKNTQNVNPCNRDFQTKALPWIAHQLDSIFMGLLCIWDIVHFHINPLSRANNTL